MTCNFIRYFKGECPQGYVSIRRIQCFLIVESLYKNFFVRADPDIDFNCINWQVSPEFTSKQEAEEYLHEIMRKINGVHE